MMAQALAVLRIIRGKHAMGIFTLPAADVERIDALLRAQDASIPAPAIEPSDDRLAFSDVREAQAEALEQAATELDLILNVYAVHEWVIPTEDEQAAWLEVG